MRFSYHPFSSLIVSVAVWLGLLPLSPLIQDLDAVLTEAWFVLGTSAAIGLGLALLRAPRALTLLLQVAAVVAVLGWRGLRLAPDGEALDSLRLLTAEGVAAIQSGAPPLPMAPGVLWLCLVLSAVLVIVVELLVNGLEQPAWSVAPLALGFGISSLIITRDLEWWMAAPVVAGYVLILLSITGVGNAVSKADRVGAYHASRILTGLGAGATALALAVLIALAVPLGDKQPWSDGGSQGPIQLSDPTVRLDQDLRRPTDSPVLTYRTSNDQPVYLRTVALPSLTSSGAGLLPMTLARSGMERAYDLRDAGERIEVEVQMAAVPSEYLPAPFAAAGWDAEGSWSYDPETLSIVASGENRIQQSVNLYYTVESTVPNPTREDIAAAEAGSGLGPVTREVPAGLASGVADLTSEVVAGAATAGQKALAIQEFLRSEAFDYSLQAPNSMSSDAISAFLLERRSGYCIHFAAAMIAMARAEGIDARMAIGFVPGQRQEDGTYAVTSHDAHSWPELYLDALGWVAFEPTPAYSGNPEYVDPSAMQTPEPSASPSPQASQPSAPEEPVAPTPPAPTAPAADAGGGSGVAWLLGMLGVLLLLGLPALVRLGLRSARLRGGQAPGPAADSAWTEVRSLFADYGLPWPEGSPGPVGAAAAEDLNPQGAEALAAIASTVERSRFSREGSASTGLPEHVRVLHGALREAAPRGTRLKALLLPASLMGLLR